MCFIEYNWTAGVYSFRIGERFTDYRGTRSLPTLADWRRLLAQDKTKLVRVSGRPWRLVA